MDILTHLKLTSNDLAISTRWQIYCHRPLPHVTARAGSGKILATARFSHRIFQWQYVGHRLIKGFDDKLINPDSCRQVIFTARRSYASAVLGVLILSVCLSHACFVTNQKNLPAIFLYHMKGQSLYFSAT